MRILKHFGLMIVILLATGLASAYAENGVPEAPWKKVCRSYGSGREFARDSAKYCLRHPQQKGCNHRAATFFEKCRFSGDFEKISARARARMLLVLALSSLRPVRHLDL